MAPRTHTKATTDNVSLHSLFHPSYRQIPNCLIPLLVSFAKYIQVPEFDLLLQCTSLHLLKLTISFDFFFLCDVLSPFDRLLLHCFHSRVVSKLLLELEPFFEEESIDSVIGSPFPARVSEHSLCFFLR